MVSPSRSTPPEKGIYIYYPNIDHDIQFIPHRQIDKQLNKLSKYFPYMIINLLGQLYDLHCHPLEKVFFTIQDSEACGNIVPVACIGDGEYAFSYEDFIAEFPNIQSLVNSSYVPIVQRGPWSASSSCINNKPKGFK